ncbi:hypothetical protein GCM10028796_47590 [Ramlibacter monticola]|uniref:Glycosyltransferase n=1 Tax=Ramlibacter monticola TaxID=1926872 RepID=A0A937CSY0_9BURK|nr:glycosyltransferase [Ramlibacter monticola]MBL0391069.1 glycosyltransferase [Ramlibacter monticola]
MSPLLSVAVPTHNRARYAIHAISSLLSIADSRLEVVVTDTSTDDVLQGLLEQHGLLSDARLKYVRPAERLDMTGNHNAALSLASGEYVCLIGDDDTISPHALAAAEWAAAQGIEVIAPNVVANYVWPDFRSRVYGRGHASRVYFARHMGDGCFHSARTALANALAGAAQGTDGLPKIYHGIVKRSLLEQVRTLSGAYFHGSSPDVSGAVGLAVCARSFLVVDYPLTIPGASGGSNTGRSALNSHKGRLDQEEQTKAFERAGWAAGVPRFFSVETVWAHAALTTVSRMEPEQVQRFAFDRLIALCRVRHSEFSREIEEAVPFAVERMQLDPAAFERRVRAQVRKIRLEAAAKFVRRLRHPSAAGGRSYVAGLETVAAAPQEVLAFLQQRQISWDNVVRGVMNGV